MSTHRLAGRVKGCPFRGSRECSGSRFDCSVLGVRALYSRVPVETPSSKKCAGDGSAGPSSCCAGFLHHQEATAPVLWVLTAHETSLGQDGQDGLPGLLLLAVHTEMTSACGPRSMKCSWPHLLASSICPQGCCACRPLSMDVCRHSCPEGSYRELGASFPGPHLQPPESEAHKGVHPEEGGRAPEDRLHPFPPQPSLPRRLLTLQPLDLGFVIAY